VAHRPPSIVGVPSCEPAAAAEREESVVGVVLSIDDESKRGTTVLPVMVSLHHSIDRTLLHELFPDQWWSCHSRGWFDILLRRARNALALTVACTKYYIRLLIASRMNMMNK